LIQRPFNPLLRISGGFDQKERFRAKTAWFDKLTMRLTIADPEFGYSRFKGRPFERPFSVLICADLWPKILPFLPPAFPL
jgi:hypothetical protein